MLGALATNQLLIPVAQHYKITNTYAYDVIGVCLWDWRRGEKEGKESPV
jgi:hypothetical protein